MNQKKANATLFEEKIMNLLGKQLKGFSSAGRHTGALLGAGGGALAGLGGTALGQIGSGDNEMNTSGTMDKYLKNAFRGAALGAGAGGLAGSNMGANRLKDFVRKGIASAAPKLEEKMLSNPSALEELKSHIMSQPGIYQAGEGAGMIENMFHKNLQANRSKEMLNELRRAKAQAAAQPKKPVVENMENMGQRGNIPKNTKKQAPEAEEVYRTFESDTKLDKILRATGYAARKAKNFVKNAPGRAAEATKEFRKGFGQQKNVSSEASMRGSSVFDEPSFMKKTAPEAKAAPKPKVPSKSFEELVKERQIPSMVDTAEAKMKGFSSGTAATAAKETGKTPEDFRKSFKGSLKQEKTPEQTKQEQKTQEAGQKAEQKAQARAERQDADEIGKNKAIDDERKILMMEKDRAEQRGDSEGMLARVRQLQRTYQPGYKPPTGEKKSKHKNKGNQDKSSKKNEINNPVFKEDDSKLNDLLARIEKEKERQQASAAKFDPKKISIPASKPDPKAVVRDDELVYNKEPNDLQKQIMRAMSSENRPIEDFRNHPDLVDLFD